MSGKASQEFVNTSIYHDYKPTSAWMVDQNLQDNNWEDLTPRPEQEGETTKIVKMKSRYDTETELVEKDTENEPD